MSKSCPTCVPSEGLWYALGAAAVLAVGTEALRLREGSFASIAELEQAFASEVGGSRSVAAEGRAGEGKERSNVSRVFLSLEARDVPDAMLLGVILSGATTRNPLEVARDLLHEARGDIGAVSRSDVIRRVSGVGEAGRARVLAAKELVRRAEYRASARSIEGAVQSPQDAIRVFRTMALGDNEVLVALYSDNRRRVLATRVLTRGSSGFTVVDPRQIFREAIEIGASSVILGHNHPSGDPTPSHQDREVTRRVVAAGRVLGIPLADHLIIAGRSGRWTSLAETGDLVG